jgi:hypothetical protein
MQFHEKISLLRFLDPACGCGNFLVISYRELRLLELEIIKTLQKGQQVIDISERLKLNVDRFYGIEIEEFPSQIAQVGMWLTDHQMNLRASEEFGEYYIRLPLTKRPNIVQGNALRLDWQSLIDPISWEKKAQRFDYIYGKPPFLGKHLQNPEQKSDMELIFKDVHGAGVMDYVSTWYIKAAKYLKDKDLQINFDNIKDTFETQCAFVSTNSITQGEQVSILWNELFNKYKIKIHFAHRTFKWSNEARGKAAVHVVIVGFSDFDIHEKKLYEYEDIKGEPHEIVVKNINPYLVEGNDIFLPTRKKSIFRAPEISYGSMANDGGHLILNEREKNELLLTEPETKPFIKIFLGSEEFINGLNRYCLWLKDVLPENYSHLKTIKERVRLVREYRLKSNRETTRKLADFPALFGENRQPNSDYLLIPGVSSENRKYIPIGFLPKEVIASDLARTVSNGNLFSFGILTSEMHMTWVRYVCGRLESRFRYSNTIVYNNFPWPENPTEKQKETVEKAVQKVLDTRLQFPGSSLADLYDPLTMPPALVKAHQELDKAVDLCYRPQPFPNETKRIEYLFDLYEKYTAVMFRKSASG